MLKKDVKYFLSGGPTNKEPNNSLGGLPSSQELSGNLGNLFGNVTPQQLVAGITDYRCFYIFNSNKSEKLNHTQLVANKSLSGAVIEIGLNLGNAVQALVITGKPTNAWFQLVYSQTTHIEKTRIIHWSLDVNLMGQRIAAVLNSLNQLGGVEVIGQETETGFDFLIEFKGEAGRRQQPLLGVVNSVGIGVEVSVVQAGGPINLIAPNIGFSNNPPVGVTFFDLKRLRAVKMGSFFPGDYLPVWIMRTVTPDTTPIQSDSFQFAIRGQPSPANIYRKKHTKDLTSTILKSDSILF